jgi:spermidine/putrescine transport system permease protein
MVLDLTAPPKRRKQHKVRWLRFYSWALIGYLVVPIVAMVFYSFNQVQGGIPQVSFTWNGFTTKWYEQWSQIPGLTESFWLSIRLALAATVIATILGTLLALALVRYGPRQFRGKGLIDQTLFMNIAAPEIVMGASLLGLFASLHFARGFTTLLLSHAVFSIAYVTVVVRARLIGFDGRLEEAASDLGAKPLTTFALVTLPVITPGVMAGALMAFALSLDDFVASNFVSGSQLPFPVWVYGATRIGIPPQVFVFGTFIFLFGLMCAVLRVVLARKGASQDRARTKELSRS